MERQPASTQHVGALLDRAIGLFKAAFGSVLVLAVASALVRSLPYLRPGWSEILLSSGVLTNSVADPVGLLAALWDWLIGIVVTWPVGAFLALGVTIQMAAVANGATLDWSRALGRSWRRILPLVGCLVVYATTVLLIFGAALFVGAVASQTFLLDVPASRISVTAGLIGMAVFAVAAVPLVVLFVYWCLALPLVATANLGAFAALRRSWRLVRGNWWRALVIVSVAGFIVFALSSLAGIAGMLLIAATDGGLGVRVTVVLLNAAAATLTTPLFLAALLAMLKDLSPDRV